MAREAKDSITVTRSQPFAARIVKSKVDGRASLVVVSKLWYQNQLNKFKDDEHVTLEIHNRKPKRTDQQNRYYWGVYLPLISTETGERDLDALHELFKGKFLSEGIVKVLGENVRKKGSTTDLGVGEFCMYILEIEELTGVKAPPTENYNLAPLREGVKEKENHGKETNTRDGGAEAKPRDSGGDSKQHRVPRARSKRAPKRAA